MLMSFVTRTYALIATLVALFGLAVPHAGAQSPNLKSPVTVRGFYTNLPGTGLGNATGNFTFIVWKGDVSEADPTWGGYRVRRTIFGVSPIPFEVVGQWKARDLQGPLCWAQTAPCFPFSYRFTGTGLFFRGFAANRIVSGSDTTYIVDFPPGAPQDTCSDCWVYADGGSLAGFRHEYAVTAIDTTVIVGSDFYETPIDSSAIVRILPGSTPRSDLERVAVVPNPYRVRAEWDPTPGQHEIHFIRIPDRSTIRIFTAAGELLRTLRADQYSSPGGLTGDVAWDLRNDRGRGVVSGIYIYQVETPDGRTLKGKFVIIK
jgi:hypothetical protein